MIPNTQIVLIVRLIADVLTGDKNDAVAVARELMNIAIDMIPAEELKQYLAEQDRAFADLATDIAEEIKLEGKGSEP